MRNTPYKRSEQQVATVPVSRPAPRSLRYPCRGYWVSVTDKKGRFTRRVWKRLTRRMCKKEYIWDQNLLGLLDGIAANLTSVPPSVPSRSETRDADIRQRIQMQPLFLADYGGVELLAVGPLATWEKRRICEETGDE